jgi:CBS domain-containing protein
MTVKECMTKDVELAAPDMSIREAAQKMREGDFGVLPVGENDRLVGMITDRDIVLRAIAEGLDVDTTKVREIMSSGTLYCFEDQTLEEVARNMGENQIRRLPVLSRQKRMVGILSLGDVALSEPNRISDAMYGISRQGSSTPRYQPHA